MRFSISFALMLFVALVAPADSLAQAWMSAAGGVMIPLGDYKDYTKTGWLARVGFDVPLGDAGSVGGAYVGATGFYGSNKHRDVEGDRTNLYGALGHLGFAYRVAEAAVVPSTFLLLGSMTHKYRSDSSPEDSATSLALGGGAGLGFPLLGRVGGMIEAWYVSGLGDNKDTQIAGVDVGIRIPLGGPPLPGCPFLSQLCVPMPSRRP